MPVIAKKSKKTEREMVADGGMRTLDENTDNILTEKNSFARAPRGTYHKRNSFMSSKLLRPVSMKNIAVKRNVLNNLRNRNTFEKLF